MTRHYSNKRSAAERFWAKVNKDSPVPAYAPELGPCWLWTSPLQPNGRGQFWDGKQRVQAYRWLWEQENGPVPEGLELDHLCRVPACVRSAHLEAVTHAENTRRADLSGNGRNSRDKTHCPQKHPYDEDNTRYVVRRGGKIGRTCRICDIAKVRRYRQHHKETA